ncbi:hypothetical protein FACS1894187_05610 [Synergistales bacterium]|nr:hypothetical protein FACS1894187_05610 [Synergistales bacterium]
MLSVGEILSDLNFLRNIVGEGSSEWVLRRNRAYDYANAIKTCPGCDNTVIDGDNNTITVLDGNIHASVDEEYHTVPCPLITQDCAYGRYLIGQIKKRALSNVKSTRIPKRFHKDLECPKSTQALRGAESWFYGNSKCFLTFFGGHGTGKSFAAAHLLVLAEIKKLMGEPNTGKTSWKFPTAWGMCTSMWAGAYAITVNEELFESAKTVPLLVIDDLSSEEHTSRSKGRINEIIYDRHNQMRQTIITTTEALEKIDAYYGSRLYDRISRDGKSVDCGNQRIVGSEAA